LSPVPPAPATLWSSDAMVDRAMLAYTVGDDPLWDANLLHWDIIGSLGHIEGLRKSKVISAAEHARLQRALRAALRAAESGELLIGAAHEDVHSAVEFWLTERYGSIGERVHTGRSRNDQVTCDLRLYLKDRLLTIHDAALDLADRLLGFALLNKDALWPGYTHTRKAMPSSGGVWAAAYAEAILDTVESLSGLWPRVDRSPLGSAAGYGVPLPLDREATAKALGFAGIDHVVTSVQNGRGKLEAAALFWAGEFAHDLAKLSSDVILFSAEEYGWLVLPPELTTGSSIMPHKRNPDLFELTRARAATVEGALAAVAALKAKLTSGYHRDFQLLKPPLMRGLDTTLEMLRMLGHAVPRLEVNRRRGELALFGGVLATDEVLRRVQEGGESFRGAYRAVAAAVKRGEDVSVIVPTDGSTQRRLHDTILRQRTSTGALGNLQLGALRDRARGARRWSASERKRFASAIAKLTGARGA
jgi:argininosuccinate lyase